MFILHYSNWKYVFERIFVFFFTHKIHKCFMCAIILRLTEGFVAESNVNAFRYN